MRRPRARLSLKGRALQLLAQRDQSRVELRGKLLRHAAAEARAAAAAMAASQDDANDPAGSDDSEPRHAEVDALLDWLEANRFLSAERFVESRVHAREARFGNRRIRAELAQHGVAVSPEVAEALAESELQRAAAVRERRFQEPPRDAAERAAQARFLAGRGFSPEVIQRVLRR
ncbi:MAG: recombination regulator RecX [Burkholderiales bacterium]|nr:recombination regulator RecX [Burkholderiales bacterium]